MNISNIVELIRQDPRIRNDIPGFLDRVNLRNIRQIVRVDRVIDEITNTVSIAEMNGGIATPEDVQQAIVLLDREPLVSETRIRLDAVLSLIASGQARTSQDIINAFTTADITPVPTPTP